MYIQSQFEEKDVSVLHTLMRAHPLGTWVVPSDGGLVVNHIPFIVDETRGACGTLIGHVARANSVWTTASIDVESVVVFQGAQTYITPTWYPAKQEHGKVVPTWNYAVVHAHGTPRFIHDRAWLLAHVQALTNLHESAFAQPWKVLDAPAPFIDALLGAIVGLEIPIARLTGKWKVSQNRSPADRSGTAAGLSQIDSDEARAMAALVRSRGIADQEPRTED